MNNIFLISLFVCHFIGDYYLQSETVSTNKSKDLKYQFLHFILYALSYLPLLFIYGMGIFKLLMYLQLIHFSIDLFFFFYKKKSNYITWEFLSFLSFSNKDKKLENNLKSFNIYFIDQILHIISIVMVYMLVYASGDASPLLLTSLGFKVRELFNLFGVDTLMFMRVLLSIVIIHKPMNVFIAKFLSGFRPNTKNGIDDSDINAGRYIGTLERMIILIFISIKQYNAIGFILTAKSITRYDKITKDKNFGEYYLLGTLLSLLLVILCSAVIFV